MYIHSRRVDRCRENTAPTTTRWRKPHPEASGFVFCFFFFCFCRALYTPRRGFDAQLAAFCVCDVFMIVLSIFGRWIDQSACEDAHTWCLVQCRWGDYGEGVGDGERSRKWAQICLRGWMESWMSGRWWTECTVRRQRINGCSTWYDHYCVCMCVCVIGTHRDHLFARNEYVHMIAGLRNWDGSYRKHTERCLYTPSKGSTLCTFIHSLLGTTTTTGHYCHKPNVYRFSFWKK